MVRVLAGFDGYMTLDATQNSDLMAIGHAKRFAIQVVVTGNAGSAVGEIVVQVSNDQTNWCDVYWVDHAGVIQDGYDVNSTDFSHMFDASDVGAGWARLRYVRTSGTGGLNFYINSTK
jgi:hypothetical protein